MWTRGQPWRVAEALQVLNAQIRTAYPQAVPPATPVTSWGSVADGVHSADSDHYPHFVAALGTVACVLARDFPQAPQFGLDAHKLAEVLRQSRDPRIGYIISNARITGPNHGWRWDRYTGDDPHDTHIHVSVVHSRAADDRTPWQIGDPPDMDATQAQQLRDANYTLTNIPDLTGKVDAAGKPKRVPLQTALVQLDAQLDAGFRALGVDMAAIKQQVAASTAALTAEVGQVADDTVAALAQQPAAEAVALLVTSVGEDRARVLWEALGNRLNGGAG